MSRPGKRWRPSAAASPRVADLLTEATAARGAGDLRQTEACYQQALRFDPENAVALNGLGNLALAAGRAELAEKHHRQAVKSLPGDPGLLNDLANCLIVAGEPEAALPHLRKVLAVAPRLRPALLNQARAYRDLDQPERALAALDKLARPGERDIDVALERAVILAQIGDHADAVTLFRIVLRERPTCSRSLEGLATSHKATSDEGDIEPFDRALADPAASSLARATAHWGKAKSLADTGRFDEAFEAYRLSKEAGNTRFDLAGHLRFVEDSMQLFTSEFFKDRAGHGDRSELPVLVVGMPRSGTTLVEQIASNHPEVRGLGELNLIESLLRQTVPEPWGSPFFFAHLRDLAPDVVRARAQSYLAALRRRGDGARRVIDKMPHNFLVLGWVALLFPGARIIHCRREPLDTCVSCYTQHFAEAHAYSSDLAILGRYYRSYERLMRHWADVLPVTIHEIRYEELVSDTEGEARRLIEALGLEWQPACLDFHKSRRVVKTPSLWQVRQPVYDSSVGRWRRYERHLGALIASLDSTGQGTHTNSCGA